MRPLFRRSPRSHGQRRHLHLTPFGRRLAEWSERFARSLADRNAAARTWSRFYEDLNRVFGSPGMKLDALAGSTVLLDRSKKLRPAGSQDAGAAASVYVRSEASSRRRAKDGVPLPPATLSRRYRFLDQKITLQRNTLNEHSELPTLILSNRVPLTWPTLARDLSRTVARLIDPRLRFLEPLLLRLALGQDTDTLEAPGDEAFAAALGCDARMLQEHRAALCTDLGHVLHLLMPVVVYFADVALARQLKSDAEHARAPFDLPQWLRSRSPLAELAPQELIEACGRALDRSALRKELRLDYERFNRALLALDESPLSNEAELRSMYEAYVWRMRPRILERLRRRHAADFRDGRDLAVYVNRKTLAFLGFDPAWILTRETVDNEIVETHVARLLGEVLGEDRKVHLPSSRGLVERNRKSVRDFASGAMSVVRA